MTKNLLSCCFDRTAWFLQLLAQPLYTRASSKSFFRSFYNFWVGRYIKTLNDWPLEKHWVLFPLDPQYSPRLFLGELWESRRNKSHCFPWGQSLRPGDCNHRELIFKSEITDFFIFCQEKPFGELFSKIRLKLAREILILRNATKSRIAVFALRPNKFSRKLGHIHVTLRERQLGLLNWYFTACLVS